MELSLYRKYRPQTFAEIAGQDHVSQTLQNAVRSGAVAHAYVFAGSRGTGKTSMAKILAKALNCTGPDAEHVVTEPTVTPCGVCESCRAIAASTALDVIEMDAASNRGIDDIRELRDKVGYAPVQGRYKVYIIDEAHMLTKEAFNALLKTLEEPPAHVVFVLATTEVHRIPATILSRCQRFDFRRPRVHDIAMVLGQIAASEHIEIDEPAVLEIARHAEGGFRDAIGTLEKLATYFGAARHHLARGARRARRDRHRAALRDHRHRHRARPGGRPAVRAAPGRARHELPAVHPRPAAPPAPDLPRAVLDDVSDDPATLLALSQNLEIDEQLLDRLSQQASQLSGRELLRLIELLGGAQTEIRGGLDPRLQLEMALVRAARPEVDHSPDALEERLRRLESGSVPVLRATPSGRRPSQGRRARRRGRDGGDKAGRRPKRAEARRRGGARGAARRRRHEPNREPSRRPSLRRRPQRPRPRPRPRPTQTGRRSPTRPRWRSPSGRGGAARRGRGGAARRGRRGRPEAAVPARPSPTAAPPASSAPGSSCCSRPRHRDVALYAAIKDAHVHADGETPRHRPALEPDLGRASTPANRELLAAIIARTTGDTPELQYVLADAPGHAQRPRRARPPRCRPHHRPAHRPRQARARGQRATRRRLGAQRSRAA